MKNSDSLSPFFFTPAGRLCPPLLNQNLRGKFSRKGFSLIELLVAVSILLLIGLLISSLISSVSALFSRRLVSTDQASALNVAFFHLRSDLENSKGLIIRNPASDGGDYQWITLADGHGGNRKCGLVHWNLNIQEGQNKPFGVDLNRAILGSSFDIESSKKIEERMASRQFEKDEGDLIANTIIGLAIQFSEDGKTWRGEDFEGRHLIRVSLWSIPFDQISNSRQELMEIMGWEKIRATQSIDPIDFWNEKIAETSIPKIREWKSLFRSFTIGKNEYIMPEKE